VGESGCGKTTLGRTILRLIEPSSGNTIYKNLHVNDLKSDELRNLRKKMQIIFQDPYSSLNPRITIGESIIEPMRVHMLHGNENSRKAKVSDLLQKVGLEASHYGRYPHEFSGGQRQRICIARALAVEPEFIICDESVSALDVSVQAQVLNLLNDLKKEFGLTYLFISHDLSVVRYMSDRLMVMKNGEIQEMGEADEVYMNPQSEYTRLLLDAIPKGIV
jgi:peptide/nickel transport system ATP-binding protein